MAIYSLQTQYAPIFANQDIKTYGASYIDLLQRTGNVDSPRGTVFHSI